MSLRGKQRKGIRVSTIYLHLYKLAAVSNNFIIYSHKIFKGYLRAKTCSKQKCGILLLESLEG